MSKQRQIVYTDGSTGSSGDFPVAIVYEQEVTHGDKVYGERVVDPVFTMEVKNNIYGRIMTLVEATTETSKLKAVKDLFGKEFNEWSLEVYRSAREIAEGGGSSNNIYTR